ncbi:hypothetical protein PR003_g20166 [Phytophthora rubi]|uniref:Uncharacterized protein n=1 Tax=Phytophthora rubi TaxID=129364 RepID=A0A6A3IRZ2_9STRA|nr:hypothetical protein PR002_g22803 [Phytophthora rubi]KAE9022772.1 hypothetical protein PR001_g13070 [Phytophthora rubi]KAE9310845.1 hypothetical protein PR003_g20166 [Phytophthora rubi]
MDILTPEERAEYKLKQPSAWHHNKHGSDGFCTRMKSYNARFSGSLYLQWMMDNCDEPLPNDAVDDISTAAMDRTASKGFYDSVKWLHKNRSEGCTTAAMDGAATNGHLDVVMWLHKYRSEGCSTKAMDGAATNGRIDVVEWLHENRSEGCTTAAMDGAVTNSRANVVRWLHENRSEGCSTAAMDNAAGQNNLATVKWLHDNREEGCSPSAMVNAAMKGYLDIIKYLHTEVDQPATSAAISRLWSISTRIERSQSQVDSILRAKKNKHTKVVKYLLKHDECRAANEAEKAKILEDLPRCRSCGTCFAGNYVVLLKKHTSVPASKQKSGLKQKRVLEMPTPEMRARIRAER